MIYKGITSFRNYLFDTGILKQFTPEVFSIGVGNLTVGGTGKTPMVHHLISLLGKSKLAVISRGYGRKSKGFYPVNSKSTPEQVGDEPYMLAKKNTEVQFFVSENRVLGTQKVLQEFPRPDFLIFDDVFQHRYLRPHLNILLSDFNRPFYEDHVLPFGRLREARSGAMRADIVVVTKCPEHLKNSEKLEIESKIRKYIKNKAPVFFAEYRINPPRNSRSETLEKRASVILISALANNNLFYKQQSANFKVLEHFTFRDHHAFSRTELYSIIEKYKNVKIVTSEKDMVKIMPLLNPADIDLFYIPEITVKIDNSFAKYIVEHSSFV